MDWLGRGVVGRLRLRSLWTVGDMVSTGKAC